jgi:hypothetical protein
MLFAVVGCSGTVSSSDDGGTDATPGGDSGSGGETVLGSLTDTCDGETSLTGQSILDAVSNVTFTGTFTPQGSTSTSPITIQFAYAGGQIVCHHAFTCACGAPDMPAKIDLHVQTTLVTGDGTFDETFESVISKSAPPGLPDLSFTGSEPVASLGGTYQPVITGTWDAHEISFGGDITPSAADAGTLDGGPSGTTSGNATEQAMRQLDSGIGMGQTQGAGSWK